MESGEKKLILKSNNITKDFKEMYLPSGKNGYLFDSPFTVYLALSIGFLVILLTLSNYASMDGSVWIFLIMSLIISIYIWNAFVSLLKDRLRKLSNILTYLKKVSQYKNAEIILTSGSFQMNINDEIYIEKWSNIRFVEIKEKYIQLQGNEIYSIPRNALKPMDFETLKNVLRDEMYHEEEPDDNYKAKSE